jgi:hypothetical protein
MLILVNFWHVNNKFLYNVKYFLLVGKQTRDKDDNLKQYNDIFF